MITAVEIVKALGGRWHGSYGLVPCQAHPDRNPSMDVRQSGGKVLVHCHAGCSQAAVIEALRRLNLWPGQAEGPTPTAAEREALRQKAEEERRRRDEARRRAAVGPLQFTRSPVGTVAEIYWHEVRGLQLPIPVVFRFHPKWTYYGDELDPLGSPMIIGSFPALIAPVQNADGEVIGRHETYLQPDGRGKAELPERYRGAERKMHGPCRSGAIRLGDAAEEMVIGEGIESTASVMQISGLPGWAAMTAKNLEAMELPPLPLAARILIFADNDASGTGQRAARNAAEKWTNQGRQVRIAMAPKVGQDANDLLMESAK